MPQPSNILETYIERLRNLPLLELQQQAVNSHKNELIELIQVQLRDKGIKGDETPLSPYTPAYQAYKIRRGLYQGHPNYVNSGLWMPQIEMKTEDNEIIFFNDKPYTQYLIKRDGEEIFEMTDISLAIAGQICMPTLKELINEYVFGI